MYMKELNPGQQRKIRIIEKIFGRDWRDQYTGMAIDAVYNRAIKDDRKSLFCKIDKVRKQKLMEMLRMYSITMGDFVGVMIDEYHSKFLEQQHNKVTGIADDYSGK